MCLLRLSFLARDTTWSEIECTCHTHDSLPRQTSWNYTEIVGLANAPTRTLPCSTWSQLRNTPKISIQPASLRYEKAPSVSQHQFFTKRVVWKVWPYERVYLATDTNKTCYLLLTWTPEATCSCGALVILKAVPKLCGEAAAMPTHMSTSTFLQ